MTANNASEVVKNDKRLFCYGHTFYQRLTLIHLTALAPLSYKVCHNTSSVWMSMSESFINDMYCNSDATTNL